MDYQPTGQSLTQDSSSKMPYIIGVVVVVVLAFWYFYSVQSPALNTESTATEQTQLTTLPDGNTTADISADINQLPDSSAELDQDAAASAEAVGSF